MTYPGGPSKPTIGVGLNQEGLHSRPELARLINLVNQDEPMDIVIFYDGSNDASLYCRHEIALNGSIRTAKIRRRVHPASETLYTFTGALLEIINGSFFRRHIIKTAEREPLCEEGSAYVEEVRARL